LPTLHEEIQCIVSHGHAENYAFEKISARCGSENLLCGHERMTRLRGMLPQFRGRTRQRNLGRALPLPLRISRNDRCPLVEGHKTRLGKSPKKVTIYPFRPASPSLDRRNAWGGSDSYRRGRMPLCIRCRHTLAQHGPAASTGLVARTRQPSAAFLSPRQAARLPACASARSGTSSSALPSLFGM